MGNLFSLCLFLRVFVALFYVVHVFNGMRVFLFGQQFGCARQCFDFVGDNRLQARGNVIAVVSV